MGPTELILWVEPFFEKLGFRCSPNPMLRRCRVFVDHVAWLVISISPHNELLAAVSWGEEGYGPRIFENYGRVDDEFELQDKLFTVLFGG